MALRLAPRDAFNATQELGDDIFGPQVQGLFDFTLLFEHVFLAIVPACVFLLASPLYILRFLRKPITFRHGGLLWAKIGIAIGLLAIEIANIALVTTESPEYRSSTGTAAAVLSFISMTSVLAILYLEHRRSPRSSSFLSAFLSVTMLFNVAQARSHILRDESAPFAALQIFVAALKVCLVSLEEVPKHGGSEKSPETLAGFWNRSLFVWLNKTFFIGFRNIISVDSLPPLDFSTDELSTWFQSDWRQARRDSPYCLVLTTTKTLVWPLVAIIVPRLCYMAFFFAQPFLLHTVVRMVGEGSPSKEVTGGLIAATVLVYFGLALMKTYYTHMVYRCITMVRGLLVSAIFTHTLQLDQATAKKSAAVTLMSTDVNSIEAGFVMMHDLWAGVLEVGIGFYLLSRYVGAATVLVVIPTILSTVLPRYLAKATGPARKAWNQAVQDRVASANNILRQAKQLKMAGLTTVAATQLQDLRIHEIEKSKDLRKLIVLTFGISQFFSTSTPVVVIAGGLFWTKASHGLDAADTFATLAITALVTGPMSKLLIGFPQVTSLLACFSRIQDFLLLESLPGRNSPPGTGMSRTDRDHLSNDSHPHRLMSAVELEDRKAAPYCGQTATSAAAIVFADATISAVPQAEPVLVGASLEIQHSAINMVLGPTGSGKSTFLKAILGEASIVHGSVATSDSIIGYCDQTCWLRNVSIQQNIVGPLELDPVWYLEVVRCCMLEEDLRDMPSGDQSLVGSSGALLSGGQKQRVALARAVYARCPLLVLDDVFSALDEKTSWSILCHLLGPNGMLRERGVTVVAATNSMKHLVFADRVINLDGQGGLSLQDNAPAEVNEISEKENSEAAAKSRAKDTGTESAEPSETSVSHSAERVTTKSENSKKEERQHGDFRLYRFYFSSIAAWQGAIWVLLVALAVIWNQMPAIFIRIWLEDDPDNKLLFAAYATIGATASMSYAAMLAFYMLLVAPTSAARLHWVFLQSVMSATFGFLASIDSGTLLNRFSQDMSLIGQALPMVLLNFVMILFDNVVNVGIIAAGASYGAAIIPFLLIALYLLQRFYLRTSRQMRHLDLEAKSPLYTQFSETAAGAQHIRAFSWQSHILTQSFDLLDLSQKPYYYMFCIQRWLTLVLELCVMTVAVVLVAMALNLPDSTSEGAIGLALLNLISFGSGMANLINAWTRLETSLGAVSRLRSFLNETPMESEPPIEPTLPESWPEHGRIEIKDLNANYGHSERRSVLENVSLVIEAGQKVGVVGRTGSGKSSFLLSLLHLLDYSGSIVIDGIDIASISRQQLRSRVTVIGQDPVELPSSVRHNINPWSYSGEVNDVLLRELLSKVGLWDKVSASGGLDKELSAIGFSQGQLQLFCLARAIMHQKLSKSKIVFVDEATSSVDNETDRRMQSLMREAFSGCTVITVAHRLDTIKDVDLTVVLDEGKRIK